MITYGNWFMKPQTRAFHSNAIKFLEADDNIAAAPTDFNADALLLNCPNGTVDLRTGDLRPHDKADMCIDMAGVAYKAAATHVEWEHLLDHVTYGCCLYKEYLQAIAGYLITRGDPEKKIFVINGLTNTGKSTFTSLLMKAVGSYATPCARSVFVRGNSLEISNGLEDIEGKRFVVVPELEDSQPLNAALLKTISGGDYIAIRPMRGSMRMILPVCKLVLTCNGFPGFPGADAALWARVTPVPFMHAFDEQKLDVHARTKMESNPEVLESILAWAVQGARRNAECQRLGKPAIVPPPELKEFLHQLKLDANPMEQFLDTALIGDAQSEIPASMLITAYTRWCILHGYKAAGTQGIGKFLTEKGFEKVHRRTGNAYVGLVIRPELRDQLVTKLDEDTA